MRGRKRREYLFALVIPVALGCGAGRPLSPMADESIPFAPELVIGTVLYQSEQDRFARSACEGDRVALKSMSLDATAHWLRRQNVTPEQLIRRGDDFSAYNDLKGAHLLVVAFSSGSTRYLRIVNYMGRYVTTVVNDRTTLACDDLLRSQRLLLVESVPEIADVYVDTRKVGEAPLWLWLKDGTYNLRCRLPGQTFSPIEITIPKQSRVMCARENIEGRGEISEMSEEGSKEEKAGAVLIYVIGGLGGLAAIIVPFLLLF